MFGLVRFVFRIGIKFIFIAVLVINYFSPSTHDKVVVQKPAPKKEVRASKFVESRSGQTVIKLDEMLLSALDTNRR